MKNEPAPYQQSPLPKVVPLVQVIITLLVLLGWVYLVIPVIFPQFMPRLFALPVFVSHNALFFVIIGFILLYLLLTGRFLQRFRLEFIMVALILIGWMIYTITPLTASQNQVLNASLPHTSPRSYGSFLLPVDKIKTDLKGYQISEKISLWFIVNNNVHIYNMTIDDMTGIGDQTPNPPYNSSFVKVVVKLSENKVTNFVEDLVTTNAIFILPFNTPDNTPTPVPTVVTLSPTFALPFNKLQLSNLCLNAGTNFEVMLVNANHQAYSYPVSLAVAPTATCLSNQRTANNTSVTVTLNDVTADVASTFTAQLSSATAIYLIQK